MSSPCKESNKIPEPSIIIPSNSVFNSIDSKIQLKQNVVLSIRNREILIKRLRSILDEKSLECNPVRLSRILFGLHKAALCTIETIVAWMKVFPQSCPMIHHNDVVFDDINKMRGQCYTIKMLTDLCFANGLPLFKKLTGQEFNFWRNPFILTKNVDQIIEKCFSNHLQSKQHRNQKVPNNKLVYFIDWKVDKSMIMEASFQILNIEKSVYGRSETFKSSHRNTYNGNGVRFICHSKAPIPSLNQEELYRLVNMDNPPLAAALVISCSRLILGCNDDIVQNVHYFSRSLAEELLHQPLPILLNRLYALKERRQSVTMRTLHLVHPIIKHRNLSPDMLKNQLCESISNLARWTHSIVEILLNEESYFEETENKRKRMNSKHNHGVDKQQISSCSLREEVTIDSNDLNHQHKSMYSQIVDGQTVTLDGQDEIVQENHLVPRKLEIYPVEESQVLTSSCESKNNRSKKKKKRTKRQIALPLCKSNLFSSKPVSDNMDLVTNESMDKHVCSHEGEIDNEHLSDTVPVPLTCLIKVTECSRTINILGGNGNTLSKATQIRIGHAHFSPDWMIDSIMDDPTSGQTCTLSKPYDHSQILEKIFYLKNDPLLRLHDPYSKTKVATNDDLQNNVFVEQDKTEHIIHSLGQYGNIDNSNFLLGKREPIKLNHLRAWKLIPKKDDCRPVWRIKYDDQDVPWRRINTNKGNFITNFRVKLEVDNIEEQCQDSHEPDLSVNQQRLHHFEKVPKGLIIEETFNTICHWHPMSNYVDNVKWAKLSRKMRFLSDVRNANHEIDMAFIRHSQDRKLDLVAFETILKYIAQIKHTHGSSEDDLFSLLFSTVVNLPSVNKMMWLRAQEMAVSLQALRVSAQIRISAFIRKHLHRTLHKKKVDAVTFLSKHFRTMISYIRRKRAINQLETDRIFRLHFLSAMKCQTIWRCHFLRKKFLDYKKNIYAMEAKKNAEHRKQLKANSDMRKLSLIYRKTKSIQSVVSITTIFLHDKYQIDMGNSVKMNVYIPQTQETFEFKLNENEVRDHLVEALGCDGPLSWNEMLQTEVIALLTNRLMCRVVHNRPIILFCRKDLAEKGKLLQKRIWKFEDTLYILLVYRSSCGLAIRVYEPRTSKVFTYRTSHRDLNCLIEDSSNKKNSDYIQSNTSPLSSDTTKKKCGDSFCLHEQSNFSHGLVTYSNHYNYKQNPIDWLLARLCIKYHNLKGGRLILLYETKKEMEERFARQIQCIYRRILAKGRVKKEIKVTYEKVFDRTSNSFLYVNIRTGRQLWKKPFLLGDDDIKEPENVWKTSVYIDEATGKESFFYTNNFTGQSSWLSQDEAARLIQKKYRRILSLDLLGPKLDFSLIVRAVKFIRDTKKNYICDGDKLSNKVNFALYSHCLLLDFDSARQLYKDAILKAPGHPVITRAYGIFMLASCEAPFLLTFQKACKLFREADVVDPGMKMFQSAAHNFFYWGILMQPKKAESLLNYALMHQCIIGDFERADRIYRKALAADPTNTFVVKNFNLFLEQSYPGGQYESEGPQYSIVHRSRVSDDCDDWSEWKRMFDPMCQQKGFEYFWYDSLAKKSLYFEPVWNDVWKQRLQRSYPTSSLSDGKWVEYYDPRLKNKFYYNQLSNKFVSETKITPSPSSKFT